MSTRDVTEFLNQISSDSVLQSDLSKALEADNDRDAVTALAKSKGYDFSSDELWSEVQKRQTEFQSRQASGDLNDEELEAIAGGTAVTGAAPTLTMMSITIYNPPLHHRRFQYQVVNCHSMNIQT